MGDSERKLLLTVLAVALVALCAWRLLVFMGEDSMFERMSGDARRSLAIADSHARRLSNDYFGTGHMLLALLDESFSPIRSYLESRHISTEDVASKLNATVQPGSDRRVNPPLPFTPRAKRVLELADEEATRVGSEAIEVTHLFVALVVEKAGIGGQVLRELGLTPADVRSSLLGPESGDGQ